MTVQFGSRRNYRMKTFDWLDKLLFVIVFAVGFVGILVAKSIGIPQLFISLTVVVIMFLYVAACWSAAAAQLREDVIADNVYYLGFLFTLTSLGVALYQIQGIDQSDSSSLVETLLANFGIALMSTIAGVFLRVLISQFRRDPAEVEREARLELVDASASMRSQLNQAAEAFNDFRGQISQLVREGTELTIKRQDEAIQAQIRAFDEGTRSVIKIMTDDLAASLERGIVSLSEANTQLAEQTRGLASAAAVGTTDVKQSFAGLTKAVDAAARRAAGAADSSGDSISQAVERATRQSEDVREEQLRAVRQLGERMTELRELLTSLSADFRHIPEAVRSGTAETMEAGRALVAECARQAEELRLLPGSLAEAVRGELDGLNANLVGLVNSVNAALQSEATREHQAAHHALLEKLSGSIDGLSRHLQSRDEDRARGWSLFGRAN